MPGILAGFFFFFFFFRPLGEHPRNYNCSATKLLFGYVHTTPDCFCAATKVMQGFCSHLTGMVVAARFLWRNEADLHISDRFVPYFGAGRKTIRTVAEINNQERELGPPEMEVSIQECQGGKTFCASFCAFLIAGSRREFSVCWPCLFVSWSGILSEMHEVRTFSPCKAFLFDMFAFFSVAWKLVWIQNNQCWRKNGSFRQSEVE